MPVLNTALVGLGWWGQTMLRSLAGSDALRITTAIDPNPATAGFASAQGVAYLPDLAAALANPEIDAVILCTPHSLHQAQILAAAAAGKHVFCEKPLALTLADAQEAVAACNRAGVVLGVGHERRFEPPIQRMRALFEAGEIGTLLQIEANFSQDKFLALPADNWRLSGAEAPAGPMTATGIHLLDLAVSFAGPAARVLADVRQLGSSLANGDSLAAWVRFHSGASALISAILATPFDGRFALYGSTGWMELRDKAHPEAPEGWVLTRVLREGGRKSEEFAPAPAVRANIEAFARAALGGAPYPMPQAQMLATVAALEAVFRSAAQGGEIVAVAEVTT